MSDFPACDVSLAQAQQFARDNGYPVWGYCSPTKCNDNQKYNHQFCTCTGMFSGSQYFNNGVCINSVGTLISIVSESCYCCCVEGADVSVAVSRDRVKAVQQLGINDLVWVADDVSLATWSQRPVLFSSGTGAEGQNQLIQIHFGDGTQGLALRPDSFESQFVSPAQSAAYFQALSAAPHRLIGADGLVDLLRVATTNADALAALLGAPLVVAQRIYELLRTDSNYLLVTGTQPFLTRERTLKQAQKLVPGRDELVRADGRAVPIISLRVGLYRKGVHHIATSLQPATSPDGHLLVANGIVIGDYATQIGAHADAQGGISTTMQERGPHMQA